MNFIILNILNLFIILKWGKKENNLRAQCHQILLKHLNRAQSLIKIILPFRLMHYPIHIYCKMR